MDGGDEKKGWNSKVINVTYNIHMLMRDAEGRKKEASKAIQTTQSKATQYTQGSHMYMCCVALPCLTLLASFFLPSHISFKNMYIVTARVKNTAEKRLEEEQERGKEKEEMTLTA